MILNLYPFVVFFAIPAVIVDFLFFPLVYPTFWIDITYNLYLIFDAFINIMLSPWDLFMSCYVIIAAMAERPMYKNDLMAEVFQAMGLSAVTTALSTQHF